MRKTRRASTVVVWLGADSASLLLMSRGGGSSSIAVSPSTANFPIGESEQCSASGTYTDGSAADLTCTVTCSSSAPTIAAVSTGGLVSGLATGTTTISA